MTQNLHSLGDVLKELLRSKRFGERSTVGPLAKLWLSVFGDSCGVPVDRRGEKLIVKVENSTLRYECLNRKQEMLEVLRLESEEFCGIRDLVFIERD